MNFKKKHTHIIFFCGKSENQEKTYDLKASCRYPSFPDGRIVGIRDPDDAGLLTNLGASMGAGVAQMGLSLGLGSLQY